MSEQKPVYGVTLPDFDQLAFNNLTDCLRLMTEYMQSSPGQIHQNRFWADELKRVFEQGRVLGQREGRSLAEEEWWQNFDNDTDEQERLQQQYAEASEERFLEDWDTTNCSDYLKYEQEQERIINSRNKNG